MAGFRNGLQKVGDTYHFCFRVHSKQYKGSTRARDIQTAKKVLDEKRKEAILGKTLRPTTIPTVTDLVQDWLNSRRSSASAKHLQSVELMSRIWITPSLGKEPINRVTTGMILEIRAKLLDAGRSMETANHLLRVVKLLWNHGVSAGYIEAVPFKVKPLRVQKKPRPIIPASRFQEFLSAIDATTDESHVRVLLRVMVGMGLRESEALGMRWDWFSNDQKTYQIGVAKGKEARVLPVAEWLWRSIHEMPLTLSKWVFPAKDGGCHRPHYCTKALQRVCDELALGRVTQHRLRASYATNLEQAGAPVTAIQEMLGHKDLKTTRGYLECSMDSKRKAQDALSKQLGLA